MLMQKSKRAKNKLFSHSLQYWGNRGNKSKKEILSLTRAIQYRTGIVEKYIYYIYMYSLYTSPPLSVRGIPTYNGSIF